MYNSSHSSQVQRVDNSCPLIFLGNIFLAYIFLSFPFFRFFLKLSCCDIFDFYDDKLIHLQDSVYLTYSR